MQAFLAGVTLLVIGDSHLLNQGSLITALHDDLTRQGAAVHSYGVCGATPSTWTYDAENNCGIASRQLKGGISRTDDASATSPSITELVDKHKPDLIMVVLGDTVAGYAQPSLSKAWIWNEVGSLTRRIKQTGAACVWVGPGWGNENGKYSKTYARVQETSDYLSTLVAPCTYIDSLKMAKPGQWQTMDGQHYTVDGYRQWSQGISRALQDVRSASKP